MTATLAHEIRNPLMGLSAQAELLARIRPRPGDYDLVFTADAAKAAKNPPKPTLPTL